MTFDPATDVGSITGDPDPLFDDCGSPDHSGNSDPLSEQMFLVDTINKLQASPEWAETAVIIAYDDSDGWYDHQAASVVNGSALSVDTFDGPGKCGTPASSAAFERPRRQDRRDRRRRRRPANDPTQGSPPQLCKLCRPGARDARNARRNADSAAKCAEHRSCLPAQA